MGLRCGPLATVPFLLHPPLFDQPSVLPETGVYLYDENPEIANQAYDETPPLLQALPPQILNINLTSKTELIPHEHKAHVLSFRMNGLIVALQAILFLGSYTFGTK